MRVSYPPLSPEGQMQGAPEGAWNNADVRGAIYAMHGRVCAYCQRLASDARGDVEHFRPKSVYPWLMYDFENYLLGCRVCNSSRKSKLFPLAPRARKLRFDPRMVDDRRYLRRALAREKRLLLDPVEDPVDGWVDVDFDHPLCLIKPTTLALQSREGRRRVQETIQFFGLNTVPELVEDRVVHVNAVLDLLEAWRDGEVGRVTEIRAQANRYQPHGWAVRRVLAALAPNLELPSAAEDLEWFVEQLLHRLDQADAVLAQDDLPRRDRRMVEQRKEEVRWTLAVLWKEPPGVPPAMLTAWLARRGRDDEIAAFRDRL